MLRTRLTDRWGIETPIVQAPMAGVSGGELAGAVSRAGGLGMIGVSPTSTTDWIAEQAAVARQSGKFGIGLLLWWVAEHPEQFEAALAARPYVVSLSFGDITPYVDRAHAAGALVATQVQTTAAARAAIAAGADAVVVQGTEAGGHTGSVGLLPLLQVVLDEAEGSDTLILAAGGIATGRGVAAVLAAGADGAWIGTRFVASDEALGHPAAKQAVVDAAEDGTVLTHVFDIVQGYAWPDEYPGRALANELTAQWHGREDALQASLPNVASAFEEARAANDLSIAHAYAGQAVGAVREVRPAEAIVRDLERGTEDALRRVEQWLHR